MTPSQLKTAHNRFPSLIQLLQRRGYSRALADSGIPSNKMTISRWRRELQAPTDEQLLAVIEWVKNIPNASRFFEVPHIGKASWAEWQKFTTDTNLSGVRKQLGFKQAELASALGISRYTYLLAERGDERYRSYHEQARVWLEQRRAEQGAK